MIFLYYHIDTPTGGDVRMSPGMSGCRKSATSVDKDVVRVRHPDIPCEIPRMRVKTGILPKWVLLSLAEIFYFPIWCDICTSGYLLLKFFIFQFGVIFGSRGVWGELCTSG